MKVELYGDSTQYGSMYFGGKIIRSPIVPSESLQNFANKYNAQPPITVENKAVPGTWAKQCLYGESPYLANWAQTMAASDADVVICNFGINDVYIHSTNYALMTANIKKLNDIAVAAGKMFIWETPNPIKSAHKIYLDAWIPTAVAELKNQGVSVIDMYSAIKIWHGRGNGDFAGSMSDDLHPDQNLYAAIGWNLFYYLKQMGVVQTSIDWQKAIP